MHGGWQTSGTVRVCQLAFNLWNGYSGERQGDEFTPNDLFCCEFAPYFMEGIKIRYPEYCRDISASKISLIMRGNQKRRYFMKQKLLLCGAAAFAVLFLFSAIMLQRQFPIRNRAPKPLTISQIWLWTKRSRMLLNSRKNPAKR